MLVELNVVEQRLKAVLELWNCDLRVCRVGGQTFHTKFV